MSNASETSLLQLLQQARGGVQEAREQLFERCRNYVGFLARAHLESWIQAKVDTSDLIQQTLLEAHRGFEKFQGNSEGEWLAWLRQILSNNATDFVRHYCGTEKRQLNREVPLEVRSGTASGFQRQIAAQGETPSQLLVKKEQEILIAEAIAQLSEDHQEVILLRNIQRLPFEEIAARMGRSRPAAQMLWMRALQKMKELISLE